MARWLARGFIALAVVLVVMQFLPIGGPRMNPPVVSEPAWNSPETRALAKRACFDCHSNETVWPIYSNIAPISWLVAYDVNEGREKLNFSTWATREQEADELGEVIREGEMPLGNYLLLHPEARLSAAEQQQLIQGLEATVNNR
ncbi:MAG: heme-binding domain-containing protein [Chloroflexaceae bacterium]|nr:heme-binding domain-containing protein [Chloroflexaceae bacterium]